MNNPDMYTRLLQLKLWKMYPKNVKLWIMIVNFFFATLPGILFVLRNVHIDKTRDSIKMASFNDSVYVMTLLLEIMLLSMSISQQFFYYRFMALRLVRVFMVGQIVSIALMILSTNSSFMKLLRKYFKDANERISWILLFIFIVASTYILFCAYAYLPFSEYT